MRHFIEEYPEDVTRLTASAKRVTGRDFNSTILSLAYHEWSEDAWSASWLYLPESDEDLDRIIPTIVNHYDGWLLHRLEESGYIKKKQSDEIQ